QDGVLKFMRLLVRAPFLTLGAIVASFIVNPYAGLVVAGALGLCGLLIFIILKITPSHYGKLGRDLDRLSQLGEEGIVGARVIRAFGKEEDAHRSFEAQSEAYRAQTLKISKINAFINPLTFALVNLAIVFLLYFGSFEFRTTALSVGSIVAIVSFLTQSLTALIQFTRLVTSLSKAVASKRRIDGFFALEPSLLSGEKKGLDEAKEGAPLYELRDISLDFGGENPALSHVDFVLNEGETVGVIGGTGSGKSTLIGLLERFLDASDGTLLYRGHPIKEWDIPFLRGQIALVSQKPQIYKGTFRANLCLGNPSATKEQIEAAIDDSLCREFFPRLAKGLEEEIEENGQNLSGGQRQRLLIGRALASERPILILDDATSALDYKSDLRVRENLRKRKGLTTLLISQRATSIKGCDRIYVLDKGKVVGVGTHDELLLSCPIYAEIYQAQVDAR
ncbi:MAG: ABC transporter ATP-binding protein, partial [Bacilli bacterium]|nr:ABC transporter ATP-binding protein [Bacilli bacterium]